MQVAVLYGSETGKAREVAYRIGEWLMGHHVRIKGDEPQSFDGVSALEWFEDASMFAILVVSTCGDGEVPANMRQFWLRILNKSCKRLKLKYGLYGLGDARYGIKFNAAARKLDARLQQLGATPIVTRVLGDACAPGAGILQGLPGFLKSLALYFSLSQVEQVKHQVAKPRYEIIPIQNDELISEEPFIKRALEWDRGKAKAHEVIIISNTRLTSPEWNQEVRHLSIEAVGNTAFQYASGDVAAIEHENPAEAVTDFLALCASDKVQCEFEAETLFELRPLVSKVLRPPRPQLPSRTCLRMLGMHCLDLTSPPSQLVLETLAPFALDHDEATKLRELASIEGAALFDEYAVQERRSLLEVLQDFHSIQALPLALLFDLFDWPRPRSFSIASAPSSNDAHTMLDIATPVSSNRIELCVAKVEFTTPLNRKRTGAASTFLSQLKAGTRLHLITYNGSFFQKVMTAPQAKPKLILVGPGTGIAPMRSILDRCAESDDQKRILFFGCRDPHHDLLYYQDLDPKKHFFQLVVAASRQPGTKRTYVTHKLRELAPRVMHLLFDDEASFFVAGNLRMAADVRTTLLDLIEAHLQCSHKEASSMLARLERQGRFATEAYG